MTGKIIVNLAAVVLAVSSAIAQNPTEDDYYRIIRFPMQDRIVLEVGALETLPDGKLAVATRRGEVYLVDHPLANDPEQATFSLFASGMHEILGLAWRDGSLYCVQRGEVTRIKDENGDGHADLFQTVSDNWGITGDYHEYAFGSKF